ncbi:MAG TPA: LptA/OstA family protein [Verrucomicrobiae bacterium]|nr:LptA/OstA family protein [Verrucomicrobiae bacterium]
MKSLWFTLALASGIASAAAQDFSATAGIANPPPATNTAEATPAAAGVVASLVSATNHIEIESDQAELRTETNYTAIYTGNVRANYGSAKLTCEQLTIRAEKGAERPEYMLADRNVIIHHIDKDGKPIHASGERAVYAYVREPAGTNELITLSGDAHITSSSGEFMGEVITWNLTTGTVLGSRQRTIINMKDDAASQVPFGSSRTNSP